MRAIDDTIVRQWLGGGRNRSTIPILRSMFNDAMTADAGRVVDRNPWMNLRRRAKVPGPPRRKTADLVKVAEMIAIADQITPPSFAAYLHVAAFEGVRPGELDGLPRDALDFQRRTIHVRQQWNRHSRKFRCRSTSRPNDRDDPTGPGAAAVAAAGSGVGVHDAPRPSLHAVDAVASLEPRPVRGRAPQVRPLHVHQAFLRLVRLERSRPRTRGHRPALRPPGRRRAGPHVVRARRSRTLPVSDPGGVR